MTFEEEELQRFLKRLVRFFPVIESLDNLERFIANVAGWTARKVVVEMPAEAERGRPEAALVRAKRWLWDLFWEDVLSFPTTDSMLARSMRLLPQVGQAPALPRYRGAGRYDPRLVAIEYDLLRDLFTPLLKRRPGSPRHKIPAVTCGPLSGKERRRLLAAETDKRHVAWEALRREAADTVLPVSWWQEGQGFWFDEAELSALSPRKAALTVLAKNAGRCPAAVWENVKAGRKMLPQKKLHAIEEAWKTPRHAPEVCRVLGCSTPPH